MRADASQLLRPSAPFGPLLEGFVLMELARQLTWSEVGAELFHYRTRDKTEVDAVLENRRGQVTGVEVTASSTVRAEDFRGFANPGPIHRHYVVISRRQAAARAPDLTRSGKCP
jgi:predicted AAA+ superfamily ATPase